MRPNVANKALATDWALATSRTTDSRWKLSTVLFGFTHLTDCIYAQSQDSSNCFFVMCIAQGRKLQSLGGTTVISFSEELANAKSAEQVCDALHSLPTALKMCSGLQCFNAMAI